MSWFTADTDDICERAVAGVGYGGPDDSPEEIARKQSVYMAACALGNWELAAEEERADELAALKGKGL